MKSRIVFLRLFVFMTASISCAFSVICTTLPDVCVPANEIELSCRCVITRPAQQASTRRFILQKLSGQHAMVRRFVRNVDDLRFMILPQSAVDQLNRFFAAQAVNAQLNQNVFSSVSQQVLVKVMIMDKSLVRQVVDLHANILNEQTRNLLANLCPENGQCEVPGSFVHLTNDPARKFAALKAMRFDFGDDALIAFASATAEFRLQNVREAYQEKKCKRILFVIKKCRTETKYRERPREFTDPLRLEWEAYVTAQMIANFRTNNANLLV